MSQDEYKSMRTMEEGLRKANNPHISPENARQIEKGQMDLETIHRAYNIDSEDTRDVKILLTTPKRRWSDFLVNSILVQDRNAWRLLLIIFLYIDYMVKMLHVSLLTRQHFELVIVVEVLTDILFFFNYVICLLTFYFWKKLNLFLSHRKQSKWKLILDSFLVIPYHMFYILVMQHKILSTTYCILAAISFLRLYYFELYFDDKSKEAGLYHSNYFITQYILHLIWFTHTIACILLLMACPFKCDSVHGWGYAVREEQDHYQWYIYSAFVSFMGLSNCGLFGPFVLTTIWERILMTTTMCLGFALTTLILIGALSSDMVNQFVRLANLRLQLTAIRRHMEMLGMSHRNKHLIINYYRLFWKKKKGVKEASAMNLLPTPLQMEISFDVNYHLLQSSLLFRNKPESFLRTISLNMKHEFFQPGEVIYKCNTIKYKMICVAAGVIEVASDEDYESPIISFGKGTVLGEAALILMLPSKTTVRAAKYCELQVLYKYDFIQMIKLFPEMYLQLRTMILTRIENLRNDEYRIATLSRFMHLNLYVSQKIHLPAIKRVKKRLIGESFDDVVPGNHHACRLYKYSDNVKKKRGNYVCLTDSFPWILSPLSSFWTVWEIIILLDVIIIGFVYPYFIAYYSQFPHAMTQAAVMLELFYYCDLYIILTTAIVEKDYMIKTFKQILIFQLRTFRFYLELCSTLPFELFFYQSSNNLKLYYTLKLNRLLKCYRIYTFFKKIEQQLQMGHILTIRLTKYFIYIVLINYWFGILLYLSSCFRPFCSPKGWYRNHLNKDQALKLASPCTSYPTLMSTYFGFTVLSTLGFNDITPGGVEDMILIMLGVLLGIFLLGYCTSELSATITYKIQMKTEFQSSMFAVQKFLVDNNMNFRIKERVMRFLELQWYYNEGLYLSKYSLLHNATAKIQRLVTVQERLGTIAKVPFFQYVEEEFVDLIAAGARIIVLPPDEIVTYPGGSSREMYIIQEGYCSRETNEGVTTLGPGNYFGIRNILLGWPSVDKTTTLTHVKLIAISDTVYNSTVSLFPEQNALIRNALPHVEGTEMMKVYQERKTLLDEDNEGLKKVKFKEWFAKAVSESFIYVPDYCDRNNENYERPFQNLGMFYRLKVFLLPVCIAPQGWFLRIWVGIRMATAALLAILIPYQLISAPYIPSLDAPLVLLDLIAVADLYLMLFVGYYGEDNVLIIHPSKTAARYMKGAFLMDAILAFPWGLAVKALIPEHNEGHSEFGHSMSPHWIHCNVRLIKILQVYRVPLFFNYLETNIRVSGLYLQILKFLPLTFIFLNGCAALLTATSCKLYHITDLNPLDINGDIATPPGMGGKKVYEYTMFCLRDSWIERSKFYHFNSPKSIYILAFYWVTSILCGSGFGDLTAQDMNHIVITTIIIMCGVFIFGYIFAYIASYTSDLRSIYSIYQGMVAELKIYFQHESVKKSTRDVCLANAAYRWSRSEGMEPNKILSIVHPALHEDAVLHLYENTLKKITLFEGVDRTFYRIFGKALRERYYTGGSYIFREDDIIDTIFIVHRGKLEIKFYHNFYEEMVTILGVGGMLGNITTQVKSRMLSTAVAVTNMDTLYMPTEDLHRILKSYPEIRRRIAASFTGEGHKDFCVPMTMLEEDTDLTDDDLPEVSSDTSQENKDYARRDSIGTISASGSVLNIGKKKKEKAKKSGNVVLSELMGFLFIFNPGTWFSVVILPEAKVIYCQVICGMFGAYTNSLLVMYQFAFQDYYLWIFMLNIIIDIIFLWGIFIDMHIAYYNRYSDLVIDNKKIMKNYLSQTRLRILDFAANMPYAYLAFLLPLFSSIRSFPVFSSLKLISIARMWFIKDYLNATSTNLMVNRLLLKLLSVFIWLTLIIHLFACLWYLFACPVAFCHADSWVTIFYERPRSQFEVYVISIYFVMGVSTNTGIGDILPERYFEIVFLIALMLTSKFLIGIFIGVVANIVSLHSSFLTRYEERIYELRDYTLNENVSDHQMQKMWNYVKQLWARRRGRQIPRLITDTMAYTNKCTLKYDVYAEDLKNSYLFKDLPESFLRQLSNDINPVMFFPGNYIVQHGDSDQSMYLIHRGEVDVLTVHPNLTETIHDILHTGEMFGLYQGLYYGIPHHFSYRARTTVDIGVLMLKDWTDLLFLFPRAKHIIYQRATAIYNIH